MLRPEERIKDLKLQVEYLKTQLMLIHQAKEESALGLRIMAGDALERISQWKSE